jgi:hypothetical protein
MIYLFRDRPLADHVGPSNTEEHSCRDPDNICVCGGYLAELSAPCELLHHQAC